MRRRFALLLGIGTAVVLLWASPVHAQGAGCSLLYDAATAPSAQTEPEPPVTACGGAAPAVAAAAGLGAGVTVAAGIAARNFARGASSSVPTPPPAKQPGSSSPVGPSRVAALAVPRPPPVQTGPLRVRGNWATWETDERGLLVSAEGVLLASDRSPRSSGEKAAQAATAKRGGAGYQGGHALGHRFIPDQGLINMFPQFGNFNLSAYKALENELADWTDKGCVVWVRVEPFPPNQPVPERLTVVWEVYHPELGEVMDNRVVQWDNKAGQRYRRRSKRWIKSRIESRWQWEG